MTLKEYRKKFDISQLESANTADVPLRTYCRYEQDENYGSNLKRKAIIEALKRKYEITEDKGILKVDFIKNTCNSVFAEYKDQIDFCYLFGSYAKGYARDSSDVDLLVSTEIGGLKFVGMIEELRVALGKKVDLLRLKDITNNLTLVKEIMEDGIKIYR